MPVVANLNLAQLEAVNFMHSPCLVQASAYKVATHTRRSSSLPPVTGRYAMKPRSAD